MPTSKDLLRYANLLALFVLLLPVFIYPAYLLEGLGQPIFIPDGEKVHLVPRLLLLALTALMGWRFWRAKGLFGGLLLGYMAPVILSTLNTSDPGGWAFLLFGPKARMDGPVYQALLVLLGLAAYNALRLQVALMERLLWALVVAGSVQAVLVSLQRLGFDPIGHIIGGSPYEEPMGSMGHIGVAAGLFMVVVLVLLRMLEREGAIPLRAVLFLLLMLNSVGLGVTQNRAAVYALLLSLLLFLATAPSWRRALLGAVVATAIFFGPNLLLGPPPYERGYTNMDTLKSRLVMWQFVPEVMSHIRGAPLLGGGSDAFLLILTEHFSAERLLEFYRVEYKWPANAVVQQIESLPPLEKGRERILKVRFSQYGEQRDFQATYLVGLDKAHNMFLDRMIAYGLFASLIWGFLLIYPVYLLWKRKGLQDSLWLVLPAIGTYYMAWFPVVQLEPIFTLLIAAVWASAEANRGRLS